MLYRKFLSAVVITNFWTHWWSASDQITKFKNLTLIDRCWGSKRLSISRDLNVVTQEVQCWFNVHSYIVVRLLLSLKATLRVEDEITYIITRKKKHNELSMKAFLRNDYWLVPPLIILPLSVKISTYLQASGSSSSGHSLKYAVGRNCLTWNLKSF